jgi:flavin-dependent dehydrogenase
MTQVCDVTILGGGLAGSTLARQVAQNHPQARILVLEKKKHPVPEATHKVGESSVEIGAHYFAKVLGLEQHIKQDQLPKFGLRFFFNQEDQQWLREGVELGCGKPFPTPSYQLDRGRLENHIAAEFEGSNVAFRSGVKVRDVVLSEGAGDHQVTWIDESGEAQQTQTRWVIDASGRAGLLKKKLGLKEEVPHKINAVWFRMNAEIKVDDWGGWHEDDPCVKANINRWLSTNHLMGEGYWVWLIPLASGHTSVGIVADPRFHPLSEINSFEKSMNWLKQHEPMCHAQLERHRDTCADFIALKHFSHGAKEVFNGNRWALTGEAGVFLDPFYSPGSDFIAMSNTFISALIDRDMRRKPITAQAQIYNNLYLSFFKRTMEIYQDQYQLFGNAKVMSTKVVWDYAVYWCFFAFVFLQNRLTDVSQYGRIRAHFEEMGTLNSQMQQFFKAWHAVDDQVFNDTYIEQGDFQILYELNRNLGLEFDTAAFEKQIDDNLELIRDLYREVVGRVIAEHPELAEQFAIEETADSKHMALIFEQLVA